MWPLDEYDAVCWVLNNTSPMCVEEEHRVYLGRAREKIAFHFNQSNSDNEKRAIAAALTYQIELNNSLIKGCVPRHNAVKEAKRKIEIYEKARKRILAAIVE